MVRFRILALCLLQLFTALSWAQTIAPDVPEPGSVEAIAAATGDPRLLSPWVSYLPKSASVPSPLAFFGRIAGAPGELVDSAKAYAYCRALAVESPRVRVFTIGHSEEGREHRHAGDCRRSGHPRSGSAESGDRGAGRSARTDPAAADRLIADRASDLLLQRCPAFGRNRLDRSDARDGLSAGGFRTADDPANPRAAGGADQSGFQSRRPRQDGGMVLPVSERQDGSSDLAAPVAAVLVEVRLRRYQSRHAPADARDHQSRAPHVSRVASHRGA